MKKSALSRNTHSLVSELTEHLAIVPLEYTDVPQMAQIEAKAHSHPMSEANLADCFGRLYRVLGLVAQDNACSENDDVIAQTQNIDSSYPVSKQLFGFAIIQQIVDEVTLMDICIAPKAQGHGYGKLLLNEVMRLAKMSGAVIIMLEVRESNRAARRLYQQAGFVESGRRKGYYPMDNGHEDAILMDWIIAASEM